MSMEKFSTNLAFARVIVEQGSTKAIVASLRIPDFQHYRISDICFLGLPSLCWCISHFRFHFPRPTSSISQSFQCLLSQHNVNQNAFTVFGPPMTLDQELSLVALQHKQRRKAYCPMLPSHPPCDSKLVEDHCPSVPIRMLKFLAPLRMYLREYLLEPIA